MPTWLFEWSFGGTLYVQCQFWLNLQTRYDLLTTEAQIGERIEAEVMTARE